MARPLRLELARYVVLNPVRSGMVAVPKDWHWSSYRATGGFEAAPPFLTTDWLLWAFAEQREASVAANRRFVVEGIGAVSPWLALKNQVYPGSERFVECTQAMIDPNRSLREVPRSQRRAVATPLSEFAARYPERDRAMAAAYRAGAYSMQAITDHFGVGRMTVSRAAKQQETADTAKRPSPSRKRAQSGQALRCGSSSRASTTFCRARGASANRCSSTRSGSCSRAPCARALGLGPALAGDSAELRRGGAGEPCGA